MFLKLCLCSVVGYCVPIFLSSLDLTIELVPYLTKNVDATWVIATQLLSWCENYLVSMHFFGCKRYAETSGCWGYLILFEVPSIDTLWLPKLVVVHWGLLVVISVLWVPHFSKKLCPVSLKSAVAWEPRVCIWVCHWPALQMHTNCFTSLCVSFSTC